MFVLLGWKQRDFENDERHNVVVKVVARVAAIIITFVDEESTTEERSKYYARRRRMSDDFEGKKEVEKEDKNFDTLNTYNRDESCIF